MTTTKGRVIHLYRRDPQEALVRLNRITGLRFAHWPESLVPAEAAGRRGQDPAEGTMQSGGVSA